MNKRYLNFFHITYPSRILLILVLIICAIGIVMQYSAGGGDFYQYAFPYMIKCILGFIIVFVILKIDLKIIFLLTNYFYYIAVFLLLLVDIIGVVRLGAQRWINLGLFMIQPSEIIKIAIILMLAKYFHNFSASQVGKLRFYIYPFILSIVPFFLILQQPDLGTAVMIATIVGALFFVSGFRLKYFIIIGFTLLLILPIAWINLHNYQKERVLTFLNPERDPLGSGYHIIQSKIAIGSGGFIGKGFLSGTQAQLDFLPEKHTDFIFTLISEEFGFIGVSVIIILYGLIIITLFNITSRCPYAYGRYIITGIATMLFVHIFVNIGMVSGLMPVVGVPLPLISYGGTSMITMMSGLGIILNIENNKKYN